MKRSPSHARRSNPILGLAFDGIRCEAVVVHPGRAEARPSPAWSAPFLLQPGTQDPLAHGQHLRTLLAAHGPLPRTCAVSLPPEWILSHRVLLPDLPESDLQDLLHLEAERGFPHPPEQLQLAVRRFTSPHGQRHAALFAVHRDALAWLQALLAAARLRPITLSFDLFMPEVPPHASPGMHLHLHAHRPALPLSLTVDGEPFALRLLAPVAPGDPHTSTLAPADFIRDFRVTLAQFPPDWRPHPCPVHLHGTPEQIAPFYPLLKQRAADWDIQVIPTPPPTESSLIRLTRLAASESPVFPQFLAPSIPSWRRWMDRYASRKLAWSGIAAGTVLVLLIAAFALQQFQLWRWNQRWSAVAPQVTELERIQQDLRQYRPFYDDSQRVLTVLLRLTQAFPEDGAVSAKSVELRGSTNVICTGSAQDRQALLRALDQLRQAPEVSDLKLEQLRGRTPLEFTFNFQWATPRQP